MNNFKSNKQTFLINLFFVMLVFIKLASTLSIFRNSETLIDKQTHNTDDLIKTIDNFIEVKKNLSNQTFNKQIKSTLSTPLTTPSQDYESYDYQEEGDDINSVDYEKDQIYDYKDQDNLLNDNINNNNNQNEDEDVIKIKPKSVIFKPKNENNLKTNLTQITTINNKKQPKTTTPITKSSNIENVDYQLDENEETGEEDYYQLSNSQITKKQVLKTTTVISLTSSPSSTTKASSSRPITTQSTISISSSSSTNESDTYYDESIIDEEDEELYNNINKNIQTTTNKTTSTTVKQTFNKTIATNSSSIDSNDYSADDYKDYEYEEQAETVNLNNESKSTTSVSITYSTTLKPIIHKSKPQNTTSDPDYEEYDNTELDYYEEEYNQEYYDEETNTEQEENLDENYDLNEEKINVNKNNIIIPSSKLNSTKQTTSSSTVITITSIEASSSTTTSARSTTTSTPQSTSTSSSTFITSSSSTLTSTKSKTTTRQQGDKSSNLDSDSDIEIEEDDDDDIVEEDVEIEDSEYDDVNITDDDEVEIIRSKTPDGSIKSFNGTSFMNSLTLKELIKSPALLAGIFGGLLVGIITAMLLLFFIIYRMRRKKFDENTYIINGTLKNSSLHYGNSGRNFKQSRGQHVTLLSSSSISPNANVSAGSSSTSSSTSSATTGLLNGHTTTSSRLLKYTANTNSLKKTCSVLSTDSSSSPNHDGSFNYAYIKAPTKEFYA